MGDNEQDFLTVSPIPNELDLSPLISLLDEMNLKQGEIIEQNKILIEHFVPSDEELKEEQKKKEEEELLHEEQLKEEELLHEEQLQREIDYQTQTIQLLEDIKSSSNIGNEVSSISSNSSYLLLFVVIFVLFIGVMYKFIRTFI